MIISSSNLLLKFVKKVSGYCMNLLFTYPIFSARTLRTDFKLSIKKG